MEYTSLDEEFNIETKKMYHKWFNKYIKAGNEDAFKNAVIAMGNTYHVLRTLPKKYRKAFFEDIWKYKEEIKKGNYAWWSKEIEGQYFYSYLSKVCYLISPEKYKIIYDKNNRIRLNELYRENELIWEHENWQKNIDEIFGDLVEKFHGELENYEDDSPEYYFCLDFLLWKKN